MRNLTVHEGFLPFLEMLNATRRLEAELGPLPTTSDDAVSDETQLTLREAVKIPEAMFLTVKKLRGAIARGELKAHQPGGPGGTVYVTRRAVKEWISTWSDAKNHHTYTSGRQNMSPASSAPGRSGALSMQEKRLALDSALKNARKLSGR